MLCGGGELDCQLCFICPCKKVDAITRHVRGKAQKLATPSISRDRSHVADTGDINYPDLSPASISDVERQQSFSPLIGRHVRTLTANG